MELAIMSKLIIRKVEDKDVIPLALLARVTFRESFGYLFTDNQNLLDYFKESFSVEALKNKIKDDNNVYWLAILNDLPVGYAKLIKRSPSKFIKDSETSELQRIYILNDFLNQKIGYHLQEAVFEEVERIKSHHLWLSVYVGNHKAIRFYKRYGYKPVGLHTFGILKQFFEFSVMVKTFN